MQLALNWCHAVCTVSSYIHQLVSHTNVWTTAEPVSISASTLRAFIDTGTEVQNFYLRRDISAVDMAAENLI